MREVREAGRSGDGADRGWVDDPAGVQLVPNGSGAAEGGGSGELSYEEFVARLVDVRSAGERAIWLVGDWLREYAHLVPDGRSLRRIASDVGMSVATLALRRKVSATFPEDIRAYDQSWTLHELACRTPDPEGWLQRAMEGSWSVRDMRRALVDAGYSRARVSGTCPKCGWSGGDE